MSKSLHAQITAEIDRREQLEQAEKEEKLREEREKTEAFIWNELDKEFARCLTKYEDFVGYYIYTIASQNFVDFDAITQKLGFNKKFCPNFNFPGYDAYCLSIPTPEKNVKRTPSQKKLLEFEKQLKKVRDERKLALVAECQRVKKQLEANDFVYLTVIQQIMVTSEENVTTSFEIDVVIQFFEKYQLYFTGSTGGRWTFYL